MRTKQLRRIERKARAWGATWGLSVASVRVEPTVIQLDLNQIDIPFKVYPPTLFGRQLLICARPHYVGPMPVRVELPIISTTASTTLRTS